MDVWPSDTAVVVWEKGARVGEAVQAGGQSPSQASSRSRRRRREARGCRDRGVFWRAAPLGRFRPRVGPNPPVTTRPVLSCSEDASSSRPRAHEDTPGERAKRSHRPSPAPMQGLKRGKAPASPERRKVPGRGRFPASSRVHRAAPSVEATPAGQGSVAEGPRGVRATLGCSCSWRCSR